MQRTGAMTRTEVINYLIEKNGYSRYLEIGCQNDINFDGIKRSSLCIGLIKTGVDPESGGTHRMTSDEFFATNTHKFDMIFVDGLHHAEQVYKDIINSLAVLKEGGTILCHDMIPSSYEAQLVPRIQKHWNGDCWRAFVQLKTEREDLEMRVIQTDCGLGIIRRGKQELLNIKGDFTYEQFVENQQEWLQAIEVEEFLKIY